MNCKRETSSESAQSAQGHSRKGVQHEFRWRRISEGLYKKGRESTGQAPHAAERRLGAEGSKSNGAMESLRKSATEEFLDDRDRGASQESYKVSSMRQGVAWAGA